MQPERKKLSRRKQIKNSEYKKIGCIAIVVEVIGLVIFMLVIMTM